MSMDKSNQFHQRRSPSAQSLGQYLAKARLASGLSISDLAQRTNRPCLFRGFGADDFTVQYAGGTARDCEPIRQGGRRDQAQAMALLPSQFKPASALASVGIKGQKPIKQTASMGRSGLPKLGLVLLSLIVLALLAYWILAHVCSKAVTTQKLTPPNQVQVATPAGAACCNASARNGQYHHACRAYRSSACRPTAYRACRCK